MPHKFKLDIIIDETSETVSETGEFSDEEIKQLEDFSIYASEVWQSEFIHSNERGQTNINWNETDGLTTKTTLPDWNKVIVFLHKFRPILLQNERTYYNKIHNILARHLRHKYFRGMLQIQHDLFNGKTDQSRIQIRSNQVLINSEKVLFDWLNSHEFHREEDKKEFIESLHQLIPLETSKVIFLGLLIDKAKAAINIASLIQVILGKQDEIEFAMHKPD
jgi:hypothetical protein